MFLSCSCAKLKMFGQLDVENCLTDCCSTCLVDCGFIFHAGPLRDARLLLKPDAYSILGIYASNEWGIKASVVEERLSG